MRIVIIMLALVIPASAHFPHDSVFEIFQFPDEHVPTMDGDSADWDVGTCRILYRSYVLSRDVTRQVR